jgi:hypothetical protein
MAQRNNGAVNVLEDDLAVAAGRIHYLHPRVGVVVGRRRQAAVRVGVAVASAPADGWHGRHLSVPLPVCMPVMPDVVVHEVVAQRRGGGLARAAVRGGRGVARGRA